MRDVGGLEVHGIYNRRLVYCEVVVGRSDYKKSYLCDLEISLVVIRMVPFIPYQIFDVSAKRMTS